MPCFVSTRSRVPEQLLLRSQTGKHGGAAASPTPTLQAGPDAQRASSAWVKEKASRPVILGYNFYFIFIKKHTQDSRRLSHRPLQASRTLAATHPHLKQQKR